MVSFFIDKIRTMFAFIGSGKALFLVYKGKLYVSGKLSDVYEATLPFAEGGSGVF